MASDRDDSSVGGGLYFHICPCGHRHWCGEVPASVRDHHRAGRGDGRDDDAARVAELQTPLPTGSARTRPVPKRPVRRRLFGQARRASRVHRQTTTPRQTTSKRKRYGSLSSTRDDDSVLGVVGQRHSPTTRVLVQGSDSGLYCRESPLSRTDESAGSTPLDPGAFGCDRTPPVPSTVSPVPSHGRDGLCEPGSEEAPTPPDAPYLLPDGGFDYIAAQLDEWLKEYDDEHARYLDISPPDSPEPPPHPY